MSHEEQADIDNVYDTLPKMQTNKVNQDQSRVEKLEAIGIATESQEALDASEGKQPKFSEAELEFLATPVKSIGLPVRANNAIVDKDIHYVYQLLMQYDAGLLRADNFGRTSLNATKEALSSLAQKYDAEKLYNRSVLKVSAGASFNPEQPENELFEGLDKEDYNQMSDRTYLYIGSINFAQKSLDKLREAGVYGGKIGVKVASINELNFPDDDKADNVYLSAGVTIGFETVEAAQALASQLTKALGGPMAEYSVTRLSPNDSGEYRLHISDTTLDKLVELGASVQLDTSHGVASGQAR